MVRRIAVVLAVVGLVAVGLASGLYVWLGREGESRLEAAIARQLQDVVSAYLTPTLVLGTLDYQAPRTLVATDARLTTDMGVDLLRATRLEMELASVPRRDRPLRIARLRVIGPRLYIADLGGATGERILGWSTLVRDRPDDAAPPPDRPRPRLSDVLELRQVELVDGQVIYAEIRPDRELGPPMELGGIAAELAVEPDEQGWHAIDTRFRGLADFQTQLTGRIDLDRFVLEAERGTIQLRLAPEQYTSLPPAVQSILQRHQVRGRVAVTFEGLVDPLRIERTRLNGTFEVESLHAILDDMRIDVPQAGGEWTVRRGELALRRMTGRAYEGQWSGRLTMGLFEGDAMSLQLTGEGLRLERLLRGLSDEQPRMSGALTFATELAGPWATLLDEARGSGWLEISDGWMGRAPIFSRLRAAVLGDPTPPEPGAGGGRARAEWTYAGNCMAFSTLAATTRLLAMRGEGELFFDGALDLRVNAGPLEKVQGMLGSIGDLLGRVTDQLVTYHVTGTLADPQVTVRPLSKLRGQESASRGADDAEGASTQFD